MPGHVSPKRPKTGTKWEMELFHAMDKEESEADVTATDKIEDFLKDTSKSDLRPLGWWNDCYLWLYLLFFPASSAPSERIFSKTGFIVSKNKSSLFPKIVDTGLSVSQPKMVSKLLQWLQWNYITHGPFKIIAKLWYTWYKTANMNTHIFITYVRWLPG